MHACPLQWPSNGGGGLAGGVVCLGTHACENITFPQLLLGTVIKSQHANFMC